MTSDTLPNLKKIIKLLFDEAIILNYCRMFWNYYAVNSLFLSNIRITD